MNAERDELNPDTTRAVRVSIRVKIRGGPTIPLVFDCGSLTVDRDAKKFDATIERGTRRLPSRRVRPAQPMVGGRARWTIAWGTRPWRALKLTTYLVNP